MYIAFTLTLSHTVIHTQISKMTDGPFRSDSAYRKLAWSCDMSTEQRDVKPSREAIAESRDRDAYKGLCME